MKISWKLISTHDSNGNPTSYKSFNETRHSVNYESKGWIKPPPDYNPALFVFKTRRHARKYRASFPFLKSETKILKVEIKDEFETFKEVLTNYTLTTAGFPPGTIFTSALRVIETAR